MKCFLCKPCASKVGGAKVIQTAKNWKGECCKCKCRRFGAMYEVGRLALKCS